MRTWFRAAVSAGVVEVLVLLAVLLLLLLLAALPCACADTGTGTAFAFMFISWALFPAARRALISELLVVMVVVMMSCGGVTYLSLGSEQIMRRTNFSLSNHSLKFALIRLRLRPRDEVRGNEKIGDVLVGFGTLWFGRNRSNARRRRPKMFVQTSTAES